MFRFVVRICSYSISYLFFKCLFSGSGGNRGGSGGIRFYREIKLYDLQLVIIIQQIITNININ